MGGLELVNSKKGSIKYKKKNNTDEIAKGNKEKNVQSEIETKSKIIDKNVSDDKKKVGTNECTDAFKEPQTLDGSDVSAFSVQKTEKEREKKKKRESKIHVDEDIKKHKQRLEGKSKLFSSETVDPNSTNEGTT